jgi:hypothetical protein
MHDAPLTPEQQVSKMLAYYDARQTADAKLCQIFRAEVSDLISARQDPFYQEMLAEETAMLVAQSAEIEDRWAHLENRALGDLSDAMDSVADPRMLLGIAVQANKARNTTRQTQRQQVAPGSIDVDQLTSGGQIIRIRTRMAERLSADGGVDRMIDREVEIRRDNSASLDEALDPTSVKSLLKSALGVDTTSLKVVQRFGPSAGYDLDLSAIGE